MKTDTLTDATIAHVEHHVRNGKAGAYDSYWGHLRSPDGTWLGEISVDVNQADRTGNISVRIHDKRFTIGIDPAMGRVTKYAPD